MIHRVQDRLKIHWVYRGTPEGDDNLVLTSPTTGLLEYYFLLTWTRISCRFGFNDSSRLSKTCEPEKVRIGYKNISSLLCPVTLYGHVNDVTCRGQTNLGPEL